MNAVLLMTLAVSAPVPVRADPKMQLQGIWKATALESRGAAQPLDRIGPAERYTLVIVGDTYVFLTHAGTLKLGEDGKVLDMVITDGRYKDNTVLARYELIGDTLKIALTSPIANSTERPKELKTSPETLIALYTFERDKTATKEQVEAKMKELKQVVAAQPPTRRGPTDPPPPRGGRGGDARVGPMTASDRATQELLKQVLDKLDRIEKRLDAMEKK